MNKTLHTSFQSNVSRARTLLRRLRIQVVQVPAVQEGLRTQKTGGTQFRTMLHFESPIEILVATILSAQCTDARVNIVTRELFKKYRTVRDYAQAKQKTMERMIHPTGFFRMKARHIIEAAQRIMTQFHGIVPDSMEALLTLPGVGRKTANVILLNAFGKVEGIAVDTHVMRLSRRLQFSTQQVPEKIEKDLMALFPRKLWNQVSNVLILHGRTVCHSRRPACTTCCVRSVCTWP